MALSEVAQPLSPPGQVDSSLVQRHVKALSRYDRWATISDIGQFIPPASLGVCIVSETALLLAKIGKRNRNMSKLKMVDKIATGVLIGSTIGVITSLVKEAMSYIERSRLELELNGPPAPSQPPTLSLIHGGK